MGVRRNFTAMTADQRRRFVNALKKVKQDGVIDRFASMHEHHFDMNIHRSSHFLPWHREMLIRFERELRRHEPGIDLPYWDSTVEQSTTGPLWSNDFLGQFNSLWGLGRTLGADGSLPGKQMVDGHLTRGTYGSFWPDLEMGAHRLPHQWVGGKMRVKDSPRDPVFYLHHAWIDLLWVRWQRAHPGAPFESSRSGAGLSDPLMEWPSRTPAHVMDHIRLGYAYDVEGVPGGKPATGPDMLSEEALTPDAAITSANGRYRFVYQGDGNLVLYAPWGPLWASKTDGKGTGVCLMQGDGNLVIYLNGGLPIWATATDGNHGARLVMQDDGNAVIYRTDGRAVWESRTWLPLGPTPTGDTMTRGQVLLPWQELRSADGRHKLVYQADGNLVLYGPKGARWATNTDGKRAGACLMRPDGNLVICSPGGGAVWSSNTAGNTGSRLVVQNDGNVVLYRPDNRPTWDTGTWR